MIGSEQRRQLSTFDFWLIVGVALLLLGPGVWGGRPLSVHEARLPQLAKEMVWGGGDWLLPTSGGRPWLERPPLPHWVTALSMMTFGNVGSLWSARLPAAVAGLSIALMTAGMAARFFGRHFGVLAGIVTVSTYEIYQYSTLAEDDIYLGFMAVLAMSLFVSGQWPIKPAEPRPVRWLDLIGPRPWSTVGLFVVLGLTNLAKGPLVGALPIIASVGVFLLISRDWRGIMRLSWIWGWVIFIGISVAWPLWAMKHYPDVVDNWRFDYKGDSKYLSADAANAWDHPWWYYPSMMPLALAPWTWATVFGVVVAFWRSRRRPAGSAYAFFLCWAIVSVLVLSVPTRKHHHYLVPVLAPWALLGAVGLVWVGQRLKRWRPAITLPRLVGTVCVGVIIASAVIQIGTAGRDARTKAEAAFLLKAKKIVPSAEPILINGDMDSLRFFRVQYTLRHDQMLIHNLSYLRQPALDWPQWYVLTRQMDRPYLERLGEVKLLAAADPVDRKHPNQPKKDGNNLALFEVTPRADLARVKAPPVSVLQAMGRAPGPWLDDLIPRK